MRYNIYINKKTGVRILRIAICDDEAIFSEKLKEILQAEFKDHNIDCELITVQDGKTLLQLCQKKRIDAVFLCSCQAKL